MKTECKLIGKFKDYTDGSIKSVFKNEINNIIEITILFNRKDRDVVCAPTHHFCNLGCKMCHLTNNKLNKCMVKIDYQNFENALIKSLTNQNGERYTKKDNLLISFMGVGEPLLNQELLLETFRNFDRLKKLLNYKNISLAIATCLPNEELFKSLSKMIIENKIPIKIHFSLHSPIDEFRKSLIPASRLLVEESLTLLSNYKNDFLKEKELCNEFMKNHNSLTPVEIHYTLIDGQNDGERELNLIQNLINKYNIPIKFILFNPINELKRSTQLDKWLICLKNNCPNVSIKLYAPPGKEIGSSCGEFTKHYYHEEIETKQQLEEFNVWKKQHEIFD